MEAPKLRFKEFVDTWRAFKLGDVANFSKGKNISKSDTSVDGKFECIRYGELYTDYSETITKIISKTSLDESQLIFSEFNDVIIPASGETKIDIATASCVLKDNVALGGDLNIIKSQENGVFLSYYLNSAKKYEIAKLAQGHSVVHLYPSQLQKLDITIPNSQEQKKIADFLQKADERIAILKEKKGLLERYKKGVMQKIFSQELRFKKEDGNNYPEWEETPLSELLDYEQPIKYLVKSTEYRNDYHTPVLTAGKTFILGYTDETNGIYTKDLPIIIFDDFTTSSKLVDFPFKAKSSAMKILKPKGDNSATFLFEAMQNIKFEVGGHSRQWISTYSQLIILLPSIKEQFKIESLIKKIDSQIEYTRSSIENLEKWKKGLLQQMFV